MPKLKTRKAVAKRFRVTKNRKVLSSKSLRRHMLTDRSSKKKRKSRGVRHVDPSNKKQIQIMLPYNRG